MWRQCTSALQAIVKGSDDYEDKAGRHDLIWLLKELKKIVSGVDSKANAHETLLDAMLSLFNMRQFPDGSNNAYKDRFESNVHTLEWQKEFISSVPMN